ncbi:MAG: hypothetical protein LBV68_08555 [Spirochaetaceae bacterium]|jgi:hypothetical protein|nr:hypothetical protein [Spirochaetaceae bacterium]
MSFDVQEMIVTQACSIPADFIKTAKQRYEARLKSSEGSDSEKKRKASEEMQNYLKEQFASAYKFSACLIDTSGRAVSGGTAVEVSLVMPVGGVETGLYRSPQLGDYVLVGSTEGTGTAHYYLIGYLPKPSVASAAMQSFDSMSVLKDVNGDVDPDAGLIWDPAVSKQGLVLRYKKQGANAPKQQIWKNDGTAAAPDFRLGRERDAKTLEESDVTLNAKMEYSEIGFYKEMTSWVSTKTNSDTGKDENYFPEVDRLNIQSTGDIRSTAANHHLIKAKRFELLIGCDEPDHTRGDLEEDPKRMPTGDVPGDDYILKGGDAQIRATNRLILKSLSEIRLQVGRTIVTINDSGFNVISKKVNSPLENTYDTSFGLTARSGITMFGQSVGISSGHNFSLSDSYGAGISGSIGTLNLSGRDVAITTNGSMQQTLATIWTDIEYALNAGTASTAVAFNNYGTNGRQRNIAEYFFFYARKTKSVAQFGYKLYKLWTDYRDAQIEKYADADPKGKWAEKRKELEKDQMAKQEQYRNQQGHYTNGKTEKNPILEKQEKREEAYKAKYGTYTDGKVTPNPATEAGKKSQDDFNKEYQKTVAASLDRDKEYQKTVAASLGSDIEKLVDKIQQSPSPSDINDWAKLKVDQFRANYFIANGVYPPEDTMTAAQGIIAQQRDQLLSGQAGGSNASPVTVPNADPVAVPNADPAAAPGADQVAVPAAGSNVDPAAAPGTDQTATQTQ